MNTTLHRASVWQLVAFLFLSAAGLAGMIELQHALDDEHRHRSAECTLDREVVHLLAAVADDPGNSATVRARAREARPVLLRAIREACDP